MRFLHYPAFKWQVVSFVGDGQCQSPGPFGTFPLHLPNRASRHLRTCTVTVVALMGEEWVTETYIDLSSLFLSTH